MEVTAVEVLGKILDWMVVHYSAEIADETHPLSHYYDEIDNMYSQANLYEE